MSWKKHFHDNGAKTSYSRARKIVSSYVGDEAVFSVNLPSAVITQLQEDLDLNRTFRLDNKKQRSFKFLGSARLKAESLVDEMGNPLAKKNSETTDAVAAMVKQQQMQQVVVPDVLAGTASDDVEIGTGKVRKPSKLLVDAELFAAAEREIRKLLRMDGFNRFRRTQKYREMLREVQRRRSKIRGSVSLMMNVLGNLGTSSNA
jgi:hypothetical protein